MRDSFAAGLFIGLLVSALTFTFAAIRTEELTRQAIERGYALYCPTTGDYAWKGECDD